MVKLTKDVSIDPEYDFSSLYIMPSIKREEVIVDVDYVHDHIKHVLEEVGDFKKLKLLGKKEELRLFLNYFDFDIQDMDKVFSLNVSTGEVAFFYWIYKKNYTPWREKYNFSLFIKIFPEIYTGPHTRFIYSSIDDIKVSLGIIFYFDRLIHN